MATNRVASVSAHNNHFIVACWRGPRFRRARGMKTESRCIHGDNCRLYRLTSVGNDARRKHVIGAVPAIPGATFKSTVGFGDKVASVDDRAV